MNVTGDADETDDLARRAQAGDRDALEQLLTYEDIAVQVGVPLGTIEAQIHHRRRLVRPTLRAHA